MHPCVMASGIYSRPPTTSRLKCHLTNIPPPAPPHPQPCPINVEIISAIVSNFYSTHKLEMTVILPQAEQEQNGTIL